VIDSFAIRSREEFYLIGELKEGTAQEDWFVQVPLSGSLAFTVRINAIEQVEVSSETKPYTLLIVSADEEFLDLLLGLKIGNELLDISIEGED